jgi:lipid A 3-O-deacylase
MRSEVRAIAMIVLVGIAAPASAQYGRVGTVQDPQPVSSGILPQDSGILPKDMPKSTLTKIPGVEAGKEEETPKAGDHPLLATPWPAPPPAGFAASHCNFNLWNGQNIFSPEYGTCQFLLGYYGSTSIGPWIANFDYVPVTFRRGWMLNSPQDEDSPLRGNVEFLLDLTAAGITSNYGTAFGGPSFFLRYNFVQPDWTCVPYVQAGGGCIVTDASRDKVQQAIGQPFEFIMHAQAGLRYFISPNWSFDIEGGYQHISNGNSNERNAGVNALGGMIGFTYYFPVIP